MVQIKSHAQKVLKRLEAGENVFRRLEENYNIVDSLIVQAAQQRDSLGGNPVDTKSLSAAAKRKRQSRRSQKDQEKAQDQINKVESADVSQSKEGAPTEGGRGDAIAAAALCQLSSIGASRDQQQ